MKQTEHSGQDSGITASYTKTLAIQAPPRKVYEAVTTVPGLGLVVSQHGRAKWRHHRSLRQQELPDPEAVGPYSGSESDMGVDRPVLSR